MFKIVMAVAILNLRSSKVSGKYTYYGEETAVTCY